MSSCRRLPSLWSVGLLAAILGLAVFLLFLLPEERRCDLLPQLQQEGVEEVVRLGRGALDASERYWVHRLAALASRPQQGAAPCLALHASLGQTHHVVQQASLWDAALSLAVFVAPQDRGGARVAISLLRRCFPLVEDRVSFHVVYPASSEADDGHYEDADEEAELRSQLQLADCSLGTLRALESRGPDHELPYPQNLMRNVARASCRGRHALVADVDMLPPGDGLLAPRLQAFLASPSALDCRKCAFTLPVFEVDSSVAELPRDKQELRALAALNKSRPFHWELFRENQRALQPLRWLQMASDSPSTLAVAFNVTFQFFVEPVYVAARGAPTFDEAFVGFGFTRNTQAYEMILSGWRFVVLDEAFLVHRGFPQLSQRPKWRDEEVKANGELLRRWLRRTVVRYDSDPLRLLHRFPLRAANILVTSRH